MSITFGLFKILLKGRIRRTCKTSDVLILLLGIFITAYAITGFYPFIEGLHQSINVDFICLLLGAIMGITIALNQYNKEEIQFLFLQTYNIQVISWYHILKMLIPLLGMSCILFISLFWCHSSSIINMLELHIEIILGYFLGVSLSFLFNLSKQHRVFSLISNLLILVPGCFKESLVIKMITGLLFMYFFLKFSKYNWKGYLYHTRNLRQQKKRAFIPKHPILKKELVVMLGFQRIFPLLILLVCGQFCFYVIHELKLDAFVVITMILIALMHDTWTLNSIGLEESTINLYIYSRLPLKKLVFTKWVICFSLVSFIGICDYIFWSVYYSDHIVKMLQNVFILLLFSFLTSMLYIFISICFSDFNRQTYYRINVKGIVVSGVCVIVLFSSYLISINLLIVESLLISFLFINLLNSEEKLRSFFNA
ncbi:hypothetical protein V7166_11110 [Bacillus thuringiensis]